jgi:hypothetical protein
MTRSEQVSDSTQLGDAPAANRARMRDKQQILDHIASQRDRLKARRAARVLAASMAQAAGGATGNDSFASRAAVFAREHPLAVAAAAGVLVIAGPGRLIKWATVLLPIVLRFTAR